MSYAIIQEAVLTVIKTHADFSTTNCLAGNLDPLKKGLARVVNVRYQQHSELEITLRTLEKTWVINIDVYVPWRGKRADHAARITAEMQKVVDTMAKYPKLNNTSGVLDAKLTVGNLPGPLEAKRGVYRGQRLVLTVRESVTPARVG